MKTAGFNLRKDENDEFYSVFLDSINGKELKKPLRLIRSSKEISEEGKIQKILTLARSEINGEEIEYFFESHVHNCYAGYYIVERDEKYHLYYVNIRYNTNCIEAIDRYTDRINQFKGEK